MYKKSIEATIQDIVKALQANIAGGLIKMCLVAEGWNAQRASTMVAWAKRMREISNNQEIDQLLLQLDKGTISHEDCQENQ